MGSSQRWQTILQNNLIPGIDSGRDCENSEIDSQCDISRPDQDADMKLVQPPQS